MREDEEPATQADASAAPERSAGQLARGTRIADYVIDDEIGRGGMGFVYSATHTVIGKRAAIKILKPEVSRSHIIVERFIQEARAVNAIHHPNIIDIFAFGALDDGRAYHIMDLLTGESLRKRLRRGPLAVAEAVSILDETARALAAAHDKGFVHRDLKPDNIFLQHRAESWPEVKLLDFGLAKLMPEGGVAPFQTKTGTMLGTPEYMSPEQARGLPADYRTDVYAFGVVAFEMLAGRRPFPTIGDAYATLMAHADEPAPALRDLLAPDAAVPAELAQLIDAMLAKEPGARPSLAAMRSILRRLALSELPAHPVPMPVPVPVPASLLLEPATQPALPSHRAPRASAPLPSIPSRPPSSSTHGRGTGIATPAAAPEQRHTWRLVLGAALAVATGIAIAFALT